MDKAASEEKSRKAAAVEASKKRSISGSNENPDAKRQKLEQDAATTSAAFLAGFDFTSLPAALIMELVVANLQAFTEPALVALVQAYRESRGASAVPSPTVQSTPVAPPVLDPVSSLNAPPGPAAPVKPEPLDPLKMDIDEEEMEYEPDKLNMEVLNSKSIRVSKTNGRRASCPVMVPQLKVIQE